MDFARNNLDLATSPYLVQHRNNPVHWQEWSPEVIRHAREAGKILFVSVGYATCHWCHVMASEAFSDPATAEFINTHFVAIKIDREQRPDIDRYLMSFLVETTGQGGWPLNAFLDAETEPSPRPFFAMTYASTEPRYGTPPFLHILNRIVEFHTEHRNELRPYQLNIEPAPPSPTSVTEPPAQNPDFSGMVDDFVRRFDSEWGGFGTATKFPPHSTLIFLLHLREVQDDPRLDEMVTRTLDSMMTRGLHDHLQGGFFRYSVDRSWGIPHFEKMLYDQAMTLWTFSLAADAFDRSDYASVAHGVVRCLRETFEQDSLYISAHDADTDHEEGATYLWSIDEIRAAVGDGDLRALGEWFDLSETGNFDGRNHLHLRADAIPDGVRPVDAGDAAPRGAMDRLLAARRARPQPTVDRKVITSWNALCGIALIMAYRHLGDTECLKRAHALTMELLKRHRNGAHLAHSSLDGVTQSEGFLEDYASVLLLLTTLYQETGEGIDQIRAFRTAVETFRVPAGTDSPGAAARSAAGTDATGRAACFWLESSSPDFVAVPAERHDHPTPSSVSLAERALLECMVIEHELYGGGTYSPVLGSDFSNLSTLLQNGLVYVVESPRPIPWRTLPINCVQFPAERLQTCFRGACTPTLPPRSTRKLGAG